MPIRPHLFHLFLLPTPQTSIAEAAAKNQIFEQKHGRLPHFQEVMRDQTHVTDPPAFTEDQFDIVRVAPYDKVAHIKGNTERWFAAFNTHLID